MMRPEYVARLQPFVDAASRDPELRWYALADSAQAPALPQAIHSVGFGLRCLFGAEQGTPLAAKSPHLVALAPPDAADQAWRWILAEAPRAPCLSVIATRLQFDALFAMLQAATEVVLPDGEAMFLAYWDPAILGTLLGQGDDHTLHFPGPVLDTRQAAALTWGLAGWWYWDRGGGLHVLETAPFCENPVPLPLTLAQEQVDDLVEASMPDHLLYYVDLNQRHLLGRIEDETPYSYVRRAYREARGWGLDGMQDLVNFVCAKIIYGARFDSDPRIVALLARVRDGEISFRAALEKMP